MSFKLQTPRLTLIPLQQQHLLVWQNLGRKDLEKMLDLQHNPWDLELFYEQETSQALRDFWIPQTAKFPLDYYWYTNWENYPQLLVLLCRGNRPSWLTR